jgi:hypothetical protein
VEVSLGGNTAQVHDGADFTDWSYVAPGDAIDVAATVPDGGVALAVYTVGDARPDGVTADGVTFRRTRAGAPLLGATIGAAGQAEVVVVPTARAAEVFYAFYCAGGPADAWVHLAGEAGEVLRGSCDDTVPLDPAARGGSSAPVLPGEDLTTRLYVTAGQDGPRVAADGLRIGLGLYAEPEERRPGRGIALPEAVEHDGHAWRLVATDVPDVTDDAAVARVPQLDGRLLVLAQGSGSDGTRVTTAVDGVRGDSLSTVGGTFTVDLPAGARRVSMLVRGGDPLSPRAAFGFGFYVRAD